MEAPGSNAAGKLRARLSGLYTEVRHGRLPSKTGAVLVQITSAELRAVQIEAELADRERADELEARLVRLEDAVEGSAAS